MKLLHIFLLLFLYTNHLNAQADKFSIEATIGLTTQF